MKTDIQPIEIAPGATLYKNALENADDLLTCFAESLEWKQERITLKNGAKIPMPRLTAWYGDPNAIYTYSRLKNTPLPWTPELATLRDDLNDALGTKLNSVLGNYYKYDRNSIGWHSDSESELRDRIVSVSLGATRTFLLREGWGGKEVGTRLEHGSVLVMTVASQKSWTHSIPKESCTGERINLTFRTVKPR